MRTLFRSLAPFLLKYKWLILAGFVFIVISNLFKIFPAQVVREAFDVVTGMLKEYEAADTEAAKAAIRGNITIELLEYGGLVLLMAFISGFFLFLVRNTIIVTSRKIEYDQKNQLFDHYQQYSLRILRRHRTGDLMARISEDVAAVRMFTGPGIMYSLNTLTLFIMILVTMLQVNPELTLYTMLPLPVLTLLIYIVHSIIIKRQTAKQDQLSRLSSYTQESYSGIRLLRAFSREPKFIQDFRDESGDYKNKSMHLVKVDALFFPLVILLIGLSTIFTVWIGGRKVIAEQITVGNIVEFIMYINLLMWPVTALGWVTSLVNKAAASQKRINQLLGLTSELQYPDASPPVEEPALSVREVSFQYPVTHIQAIREVSVEVPARSVLGLVGCTGSGKTTLAQLMIRLMDPDSGEIRLDDRPLPEYSAEALRAAIGYVPQDGFLFSDTIRNNIAFGKIEASDAEIEQAARFAGVFEDIADFPNGFDTVCGERGVTLSGGQKQRISIARAYIQKPKLMVLDDSLSAIDTATEERILRNLRDPDFMKGDPPTLVIIAHRLSSLRHADQIIVLDEGEIVEKGTHEELLKADGHYAMIFEQQQLEAELDTT